MSQELVPLVLPHMLLVLRIIDVPMGEEHYIFVQSDDSKFYCAEWNFSMTIYKTLLVVFL